MRIYNKKNIPWNAKENKNTIHQKNSIYKKVVGKQKKNIRGHKNFSGKQKTQEYSNSNIMSESLEQTTFSSKYNLIGKANTYVVAIQIIQKIIDKGKEIALGNLQKREEYSKDDGKKSVSGSTSGLFFGGAFLLSLILIVVMTLAPIISCVSVVISGADYFSSRDETIVEVADAEVTVQKYNIGGAKYKSWYGIDGNWCAMFVSWCADQCGYIDAGIMPRTASVANMARWYQSRDQWRTQESGYEPQPGDIIFFQEGMSHVGIVVFYDEERKIVYTIEGNTGQSETEIYHEGSWVLSQYYPLTYLPITGYGIPEYPVKLFGEL